MRTAAALLPGDDDTTYLDANKLLFMVSNHGDFGTDIERSLGNLSGVYYPYVSVDSIQSQVTPSLMYSGGIWLTGFVEDELRVAISAGVWDECEFSPGPMEAGAAVTPTNEHRVYKLYADSLESNPNNDYLEWPADLGAPVDDSGHPALRGDQMVWSVFNDADTSRHIADGGSTDPLGVEVHMTAWASDEDGDIEIPLETRLAHERINPVSLGMVTIDIDINDLALLDGHTYQVIVSEDGESTDVVNIVDLTSDTTVLAGQPLAQGVFDAGRGFQVKASRAATVFESFQVVANASGELDQPVAAAVYDDGWPTGADSLGNPLLLTDNQQVGDGKWLFTTADNGGSCDSGIYGTYPAFISRVTRDGVNDAALGSDDFEMRFTGSYSSPGVGGSWVAEWYSGADNQATWVPFELWNIGDDTPDDPSDDVQMFALMVDGGDDAFNLESWGCATDPIYGGDGEHSISDGDDDPWTDRIYWHNPVDMTPGTSGYDAIETELLSDFDYFESNYTTWVGDEVMARTVLCGLDVDTSTISGVPGFIQPLPEQGTIFRINRTSNISIDTFQFVADIPDKITSGPAGMKIHFNYRILNKSDWVIDSFCFSHFSDGYPGSWQGDASACDTLNALYFDYSLNSDNDAFGVFIPAAGFKVNAGMLVPAPGHNAYFDTELIPDHRNLGMTSFSLIHVNGTMPSSAGETYNYTRALNVWTGAPYVYSDDTLLYHSSGDPATGTGDLFIGEHYMLANCGPVTLNPGDSQSVTLTYGVGQGTDHLSSITALRDLLNNDDDIPTDVDDDDQPSGLPGKFTLHQNYPNPFNPSTYIAYDLPENAHVKLEVINILGQVVEVLVNTDQIAGAHEAMWDSEGRASGVYLYRLTAGGHVETRKMVLLK